MSKPIDLELRPDGSYAVPERDQPGKSLHMAYWVSGFCAGLLAGFALFGHPL